MCSLFDPVDLLNVKNKREYDSLTFKKLSLVKKKPSINPKGNRNRLLLGRAVELSLGSEVRCLGQNPGCRALGTQLCLSTFWPLFNTRGAVAILVTE